MSIEDLKFEHHKWDTRWKDIEALETPILTELDKKLSTLLSAPPPPLPQISKLTTEIQAISISTANLESYDDIVKLVEASSVVTNTVQFIEHTIHDSSHVPSKFAALFDISEQIKHHKQKEKLEFGLLTPLAVMTTSDLTSIGSGVFKYFILREAKKWISENEKWVAEHIDRVPAEKISNFKTRFSKCKGLSINNQRLSREKMGVIATRVGCASFSVLYSSLSGVQTVAPILGAVNWVSASHPSRLTRVQYL